MAPKRETTVMLTVYRYGRPHQKNFWNTIRKKVSERMRANKVKNLMRTTACQETFQLLVSFQLFSDYWDRWCGTFITIAVDKCFVYTSVAREITDIRVCSLKKAAMDLTRYPCIFLDIFVLIFCVPILTEFVVFLKWVEHVRETCKDRGP